MEVIQAAAHGPVHSALSLRLFGEDVTIAAREAATQKKSRGPTPTTLIDGVGTMDPELEQIVAGTTVPEADVEVSN